MVKTLALTPWLLLFLSALVGAAPIVIHPLLDPSATAPAVHHDQIKVASTEVSLFGIILMREDLERLRQYASDLEEDAILEGGIRPHSTVVGLDSIITKIVDGMDASLESLHSASIKESALTPFSRRITNSMPDNGDGQVLRDDANYSVENSFNSANLQQFEQLITGFIRSHTNYSRSEEK